MSSAVVFAYHNVGVRCLSVLLAHGVSVPLLLTHEDNPGESIWFESAAELAQLHGIPVIAPGDPNVPDVVEKIRAVQPDFFFSFYYRKMLKRELLEIPKRGAFNMHGSLLPKYRGRVPVNWAIIQGETETGATLHCMADKPDSGDIVAQQAVPILPDDTAREVFNKVTVAAEIALNACLPDLLAGRLKARKQDLSQGSYYGARTEADGVIDWSKSAQEIHNLTRAVAPPYPGARTQLMGRPLRILQTVLADSNPPMPGNLQAAAKPSFYVHEGKAYATCASGLLRVVRFEFDGQEMSADAFAAQYGAAKKFEFNC